MKKEKSQRFYRHKFANVLNVNKIVTIHYQRLTKDYVSKVETHDFWEINYADKEKFSVMLGDKKVIVNAGELLFIPPNIPHGLASGKSEPNVFIISFTCSSKAMELFTKEKYEVSDNLRYLLQNIMSEAEQTFYIPEFNPDLTKLELKDQPKFGGEQVIKNSLELLLLYLIREKSNEKSTTEFFLSKISPSTDLQDEIVGILNSKIYENFKLDDLCETLHYGKTFICTTFKKKTGASVYQTYLKLKTDEAKKLIRKGLTFSSIAEKLCFDSVAHFTEAFKKITGMTPREYKNSIK